jgi:hypothetical protein
VEFNNKSDTTNNRGNWNHPIIHELPELHIGIARRKEATGNILTGHCEHTLESADVNKQSFCQRDSITRTKTMSLPHSSVVNEACTKLEVWKHFTKLLCNFKHC